MAELALLIIYISVLIIKACITSADVCRDFGYGGSPEGADTCKRSQTLHVQIRDKSQAHAHCCA